MKPIAVIPWHSTDPWRIRSMYYVTKKLDELNIPFILATDPVTDRGWFSRAAAKNFGARQAEQDGFDTIIFHDADMLLRPEPYEELMLTAFEQDRLVIGYMTYRALTQPGTAWVLDGQISDPWQATVAQELVAFSQGGIIAINTEALREVGGYDERFRGWGCEDFAFSIACGTALGQNIRLQGIAVHLWHEHAIATQAEDDDRFNGALLGRYNQINGLVDLRLVQAQD